MSSGDNGLHVIIEFGGGAELLFDKQKRHMVNLPADREWTLKLLLFWIRDNLLKERPELFLQGDTVRPGILVLVNDADWELLVRIVCTMYYLFVSLHLLRGRRRFAGTLLRKEKFKPSRGIQGQGEYRLQKGDTILFISTLHGG